jgi:hypothetical protein
MKPIYLDLAKLTDEDIADYLCCFDKYLSPIASPERNRQAMIKAAENGAVQGRPGARAPKALWP